MRSAGLTWELGNIRLLFLKGTSSLHPVMAPRKKKQLIFVFSFKSQEKAWTYCEGESMTEASFFAMSVKALQRWIVHQLTTQRNAWRQRRSSWILLSSCRLEPPHAPPLPVWNPILLRPPQKHGAEVQHMLKGGGKKRGKGTLTNNPELTGHTWVVF